MNPLPKFIWCGLVLILHIKYWSFFMLDSLSTRYLFVPHHTNTTVQRTTYNVQRTTYNVQRTIYNVQRTTYNVQRQH